MEHALNYYYKSKYINIDYHFIYELVKTQLLIIIHVRIEHQIVDC